MASTPAVANNSTAEIGSTTTFPPSLSPYATVTEWVTVPQPLNVYERSFLILYEVICTVLTILLNAYLIYTILFKLTIKKNCVFIPMLIASALGLFHGFGCNLIMTISLIHGSWVGSMEWCGAAANIHKYIIYSIIYLQVVVTLEATYLISHPHGYSRSSRKAKMYMILATCTAMFINFPIAICQFFYLRPSEIISHIADQKIFKTTNLGENLTSIIERGRYYYYDEYLDICYRWFFEGTTDYKIIFFYIHTCNLTAVALVIFSYAVVIHTVLKLRAKQGIKHVTSRDQIHQIHQKRAERQKKQNKKIALMSLLTTTCVLAPWFLSMIFSLLIDILGQQRIVDKLGTKGSTSVFRTNQYLYYIVTWVFPIVTIMANSSISRATTDMLNHITTLEVNSVANSMAKFNVRQFNS